MSFGGKKVKIMHKKSSPAEIPVEQGDRLSYQDRLAVALRNLGFGDGMQRAGITLPDGRIVSGVLVKKGFDK